jgi:hypothetical protein
MNRPKNEKGQFIHVEWEQWQIDLLIELYPNTLTEEIAKKLGRKIYSVRNKAYSLRLKKSKEFTSMTGKMSSNNPNCIASRFKKGQTPPNKGKKWDEFLSKESQKKCREACFKKGNIPENHKQIGYERIIGGYIQIKTKEPNVFEFKHRIVWEQHHGKIPEGYNIQFKDGNRKNCDIDNLYIISRSKQLRTENSMHARYPKEITKIIQIKGALTRQINKQKNQNHE